MSFGGDLKGLSLGDVFQNIAANRSTGTLHVRWPRGERFVHCRDGGVSAFADGSGRGHLLLQHLLERGRLTQEQHDALRAKLPKSKRTPARFLCAEGVLTADELPALFQEITSEGIYELLRLADARFDFTDGPPPADAFDPDLLAAGLRLEAGPLLLEGARRADDTQRMRAVIGSDDELFVAETTTADGLDELPAAVLAHLDGTNDLAGLAQRTGQSRFAVAAALAALVQQGLARRARAEEIEALAGAMLTEGDAGASIRLLRRALERQPRDAAMRQRLGEALAAAGHAAEAANEFAVLGFQANEEDQPQAALLHYSRAIELHPADIVLHERRCSLLERLGDREALALGLLAWSDRLQALGLLDRARTVLGQAVDGPLLQTHPELLARLAQVQKDLGDHAGAAARWLQLARLSHQDPDEELLCLRQALQLRPQDQALQRRVRELETGQRSKRRARRRALAWIAAAAAAVLAVGTAGGLELRAARDFAEALRHTTAATPAAVQALLQVGERHRWLPSGFAARATAVDQARQLLAGAHDLLAAGDCDAAAAAVEAARPALPATRLAEATALAERIEVERPLHVWLQRVERRGSDDGEACEAIARATALEQVPFLCEQLPRARSDAARQALLRALQSAEDGRAAAAAAAAVLAATDAGVRRLAETVLAAAAPRLQPGAKAALRRQLELAAEHPERRAAAQRGLALLAGDAAAPR